MNDQEREAADRAAIEELHRRDVEAVLSGDRETLASLWTEDAVMMPPGGPTISGLASIRVAILAMDASAAGEELLEYALEFDEVVLLGDQGWERGIYRGASRSPGGEVTRDDGQILRILARQPDETWKVSRSIWN